MKSKRISIMILLFFIFLLAGCGESVSPEITWNQYIKAMNSKNLEEVAEIYFTKDSTNYNRFLEGKTAEEYFPFDEITTTKYEPAVVNEKYYAANIAVDVKDSLGTEQKTFSVYFVKEIDGSWKFISEVNVVSDNADELGNKPDKNYYDNIILTRDGFRYKYVYGETPGVVSDKDYIIIVEPTANEKKIVIPEQIDGAPVRVISAYAFENLKSIFSSMTIPQSKLEEIVIPNTVTTIEKYAFHQARNLKSLVLPSSIQMIQNYAFAGATGLETLTINVDEESMYGEGKIVNYVSHNSMDIYGYKELYAGGATDSKTYQVYGAVPVTWSVDNEELATIAENGTLTPLAAGTVTIKAVNKADETLYAEAQVVIHPIEEKNAPIEYNDDRLKIESIPSVFYVGDTIALDKPDVVWSTSNQAVGTIAQDGKFTAVGSGTVKVRATSTTNNSLYFEATITVKSEEDKLVQSTLSYADRAIEINGARKLYVGDYINLETEGFEVGDLIWSSDNPAYADVKMYEGFVVALSKGAVKIKATRKDNPNIFSIVTINISEVTPAITISENSLDRLDNLKALYINAINPFSIQIKGNLKLSPNVKIYVPAQDYATYLTLWPTYAKQIFIAK